MLIVYENILIPTFYAYNLKKKCKFNLLFLPFLIAF